MIDIIDLKNLGLKVMYYRNLKRLSQADLSKQLDISPSTLSKLENGKLKAINIIKLEEIAKALGVTLDVLFIDSLDKFKENQLDTMPKTLYQLKLQELMLHLSVKQKSTVSQFFQYKLKKIEMEQKKEKNT